MTGAFQGDSFDHELITLLHNASKSRRLATPMTDEDLLFDAISCKSSNAVRVLLRLGVRDDEHRVFREKLVRFKGLCLAIDKALEDIVSELISYPHLYEPRNEILS